MKASVTDKGKGNTRVNVSGTETDTPRGVERSRLISPSLGQFSATHSARLHSTSPLLAITYLSFQKRIKICLCVFVSLIIFLHLPLCNNFIFCAVVLCDYWPRTYIYICKHHSNTAGKKEKKRKITILHNQVFNIQDSFPFA